MIIHARRVRPEPWGIQSRGVLISSAVGFPPFIMTSLLAGALRMDLVRFLIAGSIGRLIHFGALVFLGNQLARLF